MEILQYKEKVVLEEFKRYYISEINTRGTPILHTHDYYEFLLVTCGTGTHWCNGASTPLRQGDLLLIRPEDTHCSYAHTPDFTMTNIIIPQQMFRQLFEYLGPSFETDRFLRQEQPICVSLTRHQQQNLIKEAKRLQLLHKIAQDNMDYHFRFFILQIFVTYLSVPLQEYSAGIPAWLQNVFYEMMQYENFKEGLPAMYRLCHVSREYLSRMCREYLGKTPTELINGFRLEYCASELINSDTPVLDICQNAGFNNLSHFYHLFKDYYGMSPLQFRKHSVSETRLYANGTAPSQPGEPSSLPAPSRSGQSGKRP